ncbi:hypothetical protein ACP4OV_026416 [Aristida adscensionis]
MDFHELPRRDLQALCKRNGLRANVTNAAMADALRALPKVDGIEEYVTQPLGVPEPAVKAVAAAAAAAEEEDKQREKQGSPLPRGRRVTAKSSQLIKPDNGKEEEQKDGNPEANKEAGRRGANRRARPAPVMPRAAAEPAGKAGAAEKKKESPVPRARRVTFKSPEPTRPEDGEKEGLNQEVSKEDAPTHGVGRRGASRRARPAPVMPRTETAQAGKAAAAEEKDESPLPRPRRVTFKSPEPTRPEDGEEEGPKQEASKQDAATHGVGRRGAASRRARPAPVVANPEGKVVAEEVSKEEAPANGMGRRRASRRTGPAPDVSMPAAEAADMAAAAELRSPLRRGRRVFDKPATPIRPEDGDEAQEQEDLNAEASTEDAPALGVGRRGPSRRARAAPVVAPAVAKMTDKVAAKEQQAPIQRGRRVQVKSPEPSNGEKDEEVDPKPEEEEEDVPTHGLRPRVANRRARPAPVDAPATRRGAAASKPEAGQAAVEAVPTRPTRQRRPTVKAAAAERAAAVEAPATRRGAAASKTEEAGHVAVEAVPTRPSRQRRPTVKAAAEEEVPRRATKRAAAANSAPQQEKEQEEPQVAEPSVISDAEAVPAPVSDESSDDPEDVEEGTGPQDEEQNEQKQEDEEVEINEDEIPIEQTPAEESPVADQELDGSAPQEKLVNVEHCDTPLPSQEDSPVLGLVSTTVEQAAEEGECKGPLDKSIDEDMCQATEELELEPVRILVVQMLQAPLVDDEPVEEVCFTGQADHGSEVDTSNEIDTEDVVVDKALPDTADEAEHGSELNNSNEVVHCTEEINEVDTEDDLVCKEKRDVTVDEELPGTVDEAEVDTGNALVCQEKGDTAVDEVPSVMADEAPLDCSGNISHVVEEDETTAEITREIPESPAELDGYSQETRIAQEEAANEVDTENALDCQENGGIAVDEVLFDMANEPPLECSGSIRSVIEEDEKEDEIAHEMPEIPAALDEDSVETRVDLEETNQVDTDNVLDCQEKGGVAVDELLSNSPLDYSVSISHFVKEHEKAEEITREMPWSPAALDGDSGETDLCTEICHAGELNDSVSQVPVTNGNVLEEEKTVLITDSMPQNAITMDVEVGEDNLTVFVHVGDQQEVVTADQVPEVIMAHDVEEKAVLISDERQKSAATLDQYVVDDHFETDFTYADEQKELATSDKLPELAGTDGEVVEEERAAVSTEEIMQTTGTIDECVEKDHFEITLVGHDEKKKVVTADNVTEAFTDNLTQEVDIAGASSEPSASALFHDIKPISPSNNIVDPTVSQDENISVYKNSSGKNITESMSRNEQKGIKMPKKSVDLEKLSLRQLRTRVKEALNATKTKEAKRVPLGRLEENVFRSVANGE